MSPTPTTLTSSTLFPILFFLSVTLQQVISKVPLSTASDLDEAVQHGKVAFETWSGMTIKQRAAIMFRFHSLVDKHSSELAGIIVTENGKNMTEAMADVAKGNETAEWATSLPQVRKPLSIVQSVEIWLYFYIVVISVSVEWCIGKPSSSYLLPSYPPVALASHIT